MSYHLSSAHNIVISSSDKALSNRTSKIFATSSRNLSSTEQKAAWARRTCLWLCEDLLPFNLVKGNGFLKWMMRNGYVSDVSQICSNVTLSGSALNDCFTIVYNAVKEKFIKTPSAITVVTDLWTSLGKQSYITLSVRFMDFDWKLVNIVLSTEPIQHPHTGENIAKAIRENLESAGLSDKLVIAVGDNGRNVVRLGPHFAQNKVMQPLLTNCKQYCRCLGHCIHLVLNSDCISDERFELAINIISKIKRIHGVLAYRMNDIREEYLRQQLNELIICMDEISSVSAELLSDEEHVETGDEEFIDIIRAKYTECVGGFEVQSRFEQFNVTRWKSAQNMVVSFVKNFGMN